MNAKQRRRARRDPGIEVIFKEPPAKPSRCISDWMEGPLFKSEPSIRVRLREVRALVSGALSNAVATNIYLAIGGLPVARSPLRVVRQPARM